MANISLEQATILQKRLRHIIYLNQYGEVKLKKLIVKELQNQEEIPSHKRVDILEGMRLKDYVEMLKAEIEEENQQ